MMSRIKCYAHKLSIPAVPSASFVNTKISPEIHHSPEVIKWTQQQWASFGDGKEAPSYHEITNHFMGNWTAYSNYLHELFDLLSKEGSGVVGEHQQLFESRGGLAGHMYLVQSFIALGIDVTKLFKTGLWVPVYIASIHEDSFIFYKGSSLDQELSKTGLTPVGRCCYVQSNRTEINAIHDEIVADTIANGKLPSGLSAYINVNIIDIPQVTTTVLKDGTIQVTLQAVARSKEHSLSGQATHCFQVRPGSSEPLLYFVLGTGEGHFIADSMNGPISRILWKAVADTFPAMCLAMTDSGSFDSKSRDTAWQGLVDRLWKTSKIAAMRRWMATWFMRLTTPFAVEMNRRITNTIYNKGAVILYTPFEITAWEKTHEIKPGNIIDVNDIDWSNLTLAELLTIMDPAKLDEKKAIANDIHGGVLLLNHTVIGDSLIMPSDTFFQAGNAMTEEKRAIVRKAYRRIVLTHMAEQRKVSGEMAAVSSDFWIGTGATMRHFWAWSFLSVCWAQLLSEVTKQLGPEVSEGDIKEYIEDIHAEQAVVTEEKGGETNK